MVPAPSITCRLTCEAQNWIEIRNKRNTGRLTCGAQNWIKI